jgi:hypothetical protein
VAYPNFEIYPGSKCLMDGLKHSSAQGKQAHSFDRKVMLIIV